MSRYFQFSELRIVQYRYLEVNMLSTPIGGDMTTEQSTRVLDGLMPILFPTQSLPLAPQTSSPATRKRLAAALSCSSLQHCLFMTSSKMV